MQLNKEIEIVNISDIDGISTVTIDKKQYFLGEFKDFSNNTSLKNFLKNKNFSISWTRLKHNEVLRKHKHNTESMIIICQGNGKVIGDLEKNISEFDTVIIPKSKEHGFIGAAPDGFTALSIQFEDRSIYAKGKDPLILEFDGAVIDNQSSYFSSLLDYNEVLFNKHINLDIFSIYKNKIMENEVKKNIFLGCLKYWSTAFQDIIASRKCTTKSEPHLSLAIEHFTEEFGHNNLLEIEPFYDPLVSATSQWFVYQMYIRNDIEKTLIIHFVLEKAGHAFHKMSIKELSGLSDNYFKLHAEEDEHHIQMGVDAMKNIINENNIEDLKNLLKESWDMLDTLFERINYLIKNS